VPLRQPVGAEEAEYTITPGDDLKIEVWGQERFNWNAKVQPDGTVVLPLIGQTKVQGSRLKELEAQIAQTLGAQAGGQVPQVRISVGESAGVQFTVSGNVNSPGRFSPGRSVSVIEALALAGGPSPSANLKKIRVLRRVGTGFQEYFLDARRIFKGDSKRVNLKVLQVLQHGDRIIVP
jgi:polysaccharide export outer membrane protein